MYGDCWVNKNRTHKTIMYLVSSPEAAFDVTDPVEEGTATLLVSDAEVATEVEGVADEERVELNKAPVAALDATESTEVVVGTLLVVEEERTDDEVAVSMLELL